MLSAPRNFLEGLKDHLRAHRLVFRKGLWKVILIPGFVSLIYFPAVLVLTWLLFSNFAEFATAHWIPERLQSPILSIILGILLSIVGSFLAFLFFRNIIMILFSPGLGYLSEKAEDRAYDLEEPPFNWKGVLHSFARGTGVSLLTLVLSLLVLAFCYLLVLIPVIGVVVSVVIMPLSQMFFAGIGFADPALDRRKFSISRTFGYSYRNRWRLAGHGAGFIALLAIPVLGWFLAPSYGIIAGTLGAAALSREAGESDKALGDREDANVGSEREVGAIRCR